MLKTKVQDFIVFLTSAAADLLNTCVFISFPSFFSQYRLPSCLLSIFQNGQTKILTGGLKV